MNLIEIQTSVAIAIESVIGIITIIYMIKKLKNIKP